MAAHDAAKLWRGATLIFQEVARLRAVEFSQTTRSLQAHASDISRLVRAEAVGARGPAPTASAHAPPPPMQEVCQAYTGEPASVAGQDATRVNPRHEPQLETWESPSTGHTARAGAGEEEGHVTAAGGDQTAASTLVYEPTDAKVVAGVATRVVVDTSSSEYVERVAAAAGLHAPRAHVIPGPEGHGTQPAFSTAADVGATRLTSHGITARPVDTPATPPSAAKLEGNSPPVTPSAAPPAPAPRRKRQFREVAVPASPLARVFGFGSLAASMAFGAAGEAVTRGLGMGAPAAAGGAAGAIHISEAQAERLAEGLCRMRGAALKIGQMLSLSDESMLPPAVAKVLERVRTQADVMPKRQLEKQMAQELGPDWREKLGGDAFSDAPIAAASIGQVHKSTLPDGRVVAIKVQYPGVAESINSDLNNLKTLLSVMNFLPKGLYLDSFIQVAREELVAECDYEREAECQQRFQALVGDDSDFEVPTVIKELSTKRILTTTWLEGVPIDAAVDGGLAVQYRNRIARKLLKLTLKELFEWRFMQTDPNWGNFFYNKDTDVIGLLDFGATRSFRKDFVDDYLRLVWAAANNDRDTILNVSIKLGFLTGLESKVMLDAHVDSGLVVGEPFRNHEPFEFKTHGIMQRVGQHGATFAEHRLTPPPTEVYALHRKLAGAFLICIRMGAVMPCRDMLEEVYDNYVWGAEEGADEEGAARRVLLSGPAVKEGSHVMASEEVPRIIGSVLYGCGVQDNAVLDACLSAARKPSDRPFTIPTSTLSRVVDFTVSITPQDRHSDLRKTLMKLFTKDTGFLREVLVILLTTLGGTELAQTVAASRTEPMSASLGERGAASATPASSFTSSVTRRDELGRLVGVTSSAQHLDGAAASGRPSAAVPAPFSGLAPRSGVPSSASSVVSSSGDGGGGQHQRAGPTLQASPGRRAVDAGAQGEAAALFSRPPAAPPTARLERYAPPHEQPVEGRGGPAGSSATVLDALLAYAASSDVVPSGEGYSEGGGDGAGRDALLLTYGATVQVRSADVGGGFLLATPPRVVQSGLGGWLEVPVPGSAGGSGTGSPGSVYVVTHACEGGRADGLPVRTGDSLCLRNVETGHYLGVSTPSSGGGDRGAYPPYASTDARPVALSPSSEQSPSQADAWMIVAPDSLLTALKVLQGISVGGKSVPSRALPRPFVTLSQRVLLLSHGAAVGGGQHTGSVRDSAQDAAMRLQCLQTSARSSTSISRQGLLAGSSPLFVDGLATRLGAESLSPAALATAVVSQPPSGSLWSFCAVHVSGRLGVLLPLAFPPEWALLSGARLLPFDLKPHSLASSLVGTPAGGESAQVRRGAGATGLTLTPAAASALGPALCLRLGVVPAGGAAGLSTLPEAQVLDHVLDALLGSPGGLISAHVHSLEEGGGDACVWDAACSGPLLGGLLRDVVFRVNDPDTVVRTGVRCDGQTAALVQRILPLSRHYVRCAWWVERRSRYGQGLTAQAMAAAVRGLLREYTQLIVQLERLVQAPALGTQPLSLMQAWYFLQPSLRTLSALDGILYTVGNPATGGVGAQDATGAALLNTVCASHASSGDDVVRTLAAFLVEKASGPMLSLLSTWLYHGELDDPFGDFFVQEGASSVQDRAGAGGWEEDSGTVSHPAEVVTTAPAPRARGERWEWSTRFCLAGEGRIPVFLRPHADAILTCGKYSAALNECREAAQENALSLAARRAGIAAAVASWGGIEAMATAGGGGAGGGGSGPFGSSNALGSPTKLLRAPSAILGADLPVPQPAGFSRRNSGMSGTSVVTSPSAVVVGSGSVLDTVFESRRASTAVSAVNAFSSMPAAGVASNSLPGSIGIGGQLVPSSPSTQQHADRVLTPSWSARAAHAAATAAVAEATKTDDGVAPPVDVGPPRFVPPFAGAVPFSMDPDAYGTIVSRAYSWSAGALLRFFTYEGRAEGGHHAGHIPPSSAAARAPLYPQLESLFRVSGGGADLHGRLRTLKTFFLCASSDWLATFLEGADGELGKYAVEPTPEPGKPIVPRGTLSLPRIQVQFEAALRASIASEDPHCESVRPVLAPCSLLAQIDALSYAGVLAGGGGRPAPAHPVGICGHSVFTLDVSVPWPASIVLHRRGIAQYQLLFRHLFFLAYAQRAVDRCWGSQQGCKELNLRATLSASYLLRHRMLAFLASIGYYMTVEVVEPLWDALQQGLHSAGTLDDVRGAHDFFLHACTAQTLLTSPDLLKTLTKLVTLCLLFADQIATAIEKHRLSEVELDRRVGSNRAGERAREQRDKGDNAASEEEEDAGVSSRGGAGSARSRSGSSAGAGGVASRRSSKAGGGGPAPPGGGVAGRSGNAGERERRKARLAAQTDAMRHTLAQAGWQKLIEKSGRMFDSLLRDFMSALSSRTRVDAGSHLVHLLTRLDLNGFYAATTAQAAAALAAVPQAAVPQLVPAAAVPPWAQTAPPSTRAFAAGGGGQGYASGRAGNEYDV